MRHLGAMFLGCLVSLLVLFLVAGPDGLTLVFLLVVCTAGIGLIPVLLVSWLVGLLLLSIFSVAQQAGG